MFEYNVVHENYATDTNTVDIDFMLIHLSNEMDKI